MFVCLTLFNNFIKHLEYIIPIKEVICYYKFRNGLIIMDKIEVIDKILKMYYEYGFPFKIDERLPISEHYSLNETFDISCDFLKQYDSNWKNFN